MSSNGMSDRSNWLDEVELNTVAISNMSIDSKLVDADGRRGWYREVTVDSAAVHTLRVARTFFRHLPCVAYRHRVHAWLKVFAVRMSHVPISCSPFSYFIHRLYRSRTVTSTPRSRLHLPCRKVPDPKARDKRTSARAARSLATWPIPRTPQFMSPKSSTRLLLQMETRRLSTIRTTITSLTSRKSHHSVRSFCFPRFSW